MREISRALGCSRRLVFVRSNEGVEGIAGGAEEQQSDPLWMLQIDWPAIIHDLGLGHPLKFLWEERAQHLITYSQAKRTPNGCMRCWAKRLAKFGLELHPDKTRLIDFRPPAARAGAGNDAAHDVRLSRLSPCVGQVARGNHTTLGAAYTAKASVWRGLLGDQRAMPPAHAVLAVGRATAASTQPDARGAFRLLRHHRQLSALIRRRLLDAAAVAQMVVLAAALVEKHCHLAEVLAVEVERYPLL